MAADIDVGPMQNRSVDWALLPDQLFWDWLAEDRREEVPVEGGIVGEGNSWRIPLRFFRDSGTNFKFQD